MKRGGSEVDLHRRLNVGSPLCCKTFCSLKPFCLFAVYISISAVKRYVITGVSMSFLVLLFYGQIIKHTYRTLVFFGDIHNDLISP